MIEFEKEGAGRWLVMRDGIRSGLVMGGNGKYQAENTKGAFIGNAPCRKAAGDLLFKHNNNGTLRHG